MKKEFTVEKLDYEKYCTFIPVEKENVNPEPWWASHTLAYGNYDIDYLITFCRMLLTTIDRFKDRPKDLPFTLTHSLKKMLAFLEVEKDQMK